MNDQFWIDLKLPGKIRPVRVHRLSREACSHILLRFTGLLECPQCDLSLAEWIRLQGQTPFRWSGDQRDELATTFKAHEPELRRAKCRTQSLVAQLERLLHDWQRAKTRAEPDSARDEKALKRLSLATSVLRARVAEPGKAQDIAAAFLCADWQQLRGNLDCLQQGLESTIRFIKAHRSRSGPAPNQPLRNLGEGFLTIVESHGILPTGKLASDLFDILLRAAGAKISDTKRELNRARRRLKDRE